MRQIARVLKGMVMLLGLFCIGYGTLGVVGLNPGGFHQELGIRMAGAFMVFMGILYLFPNSRIAFDRRRKFAYYIISILPAFLVLGYGLFTILHNGWSSFVSQGGGEMTLGIMIGASMAPASLYLYDKSHITRE